MNDKKVVLEATLKVAGPLLDSFAKSQISYVKYLKDQAHNDAKEFLLELEKNIVDGNLSPAGKKYLVQKIKSSANLQKNFLRFIVAVGEESINIIP